MASYPGHPARRPDDLGLQRPAPAKVPFLGKTVYQASYTEKSAHNQESLKQVVLPPPSGVSLDGRTVTGLAYTAHGPMEEFVARPEPTPAWAVPREKTDAPFVGDTSYVAHYPPHPGARPSATARKPQVAAATEAPFDATTTHRDMHRLLPLPKSDAHVPKRGDGYDIPSETRDFSTQHLDDYTPKRPLPGTQCIAATLPRPPSPSAAPQAWENEHVLWDTKRGTWAL
jgi:hypothetical protein